MESQERDCSTEERRKAKRFNGTVIEYSLKEKGPIKETTFIRNISLKGVSIVVGEEIEKGVVLYLNIYSAAAKTSIEVRGKVVWKVRSSYLIGSKLKHYDLGIEFIDINNDNGKQLAELLCAAEKHLIKDLNP